MGRAGRTIYCICRQLTVILLLGSLFLLFGCDKKQSSETTIPSVSVATVIQKKIPLYLEYVGNTKSPWEVEIRARVEGFLQRQAVSDGAYVKKGELLFVIDPRPFQAKLAEAKASLSIAIANREFYKAEAARMSKLVKEGAVSREKYDLTIAQYKEAIGQVQKDEANVQTAQLNLSYCWMYSPLDGRMGIGIVDEGNLVGGLSQTKLSDIVQLDPMYVYFSPPAKDLPIIMEHKKQHPLKASITLPGNGANLYYHGVVDFIDNKVTNTTSTIRMRVLTKNPDKTLLPGLFVTVKLLLERYSNAILIPQKAVMEGQNILYVYVLNQQNKIAVRNIKIGKVYKDMQVITDGLKPGERVVTDGLQQVRPGMQVKPEAHQSKSQSRAS